jgi:hypothetical protein
MTDAPGRPSRSRQPGGVVMREMAGDIVAEGRDLAPAALDRESAARVERAAGRWVDRVRRLAADGRARASAHREIRHDVEQHARVRVCARVIRRESFASVARLPRPLEPRAEGLELGPGRIGFLCAALRHRVGGVAGCAIERGVEAESGSVVAREAADEGVAGAGRIDRMNLDGCDTPEALRRRQKRTAGAQRHDHRLDAPGDEAPRRGGDLVLRLDRHAGQDRELGLVRGIVRVNSILPARAQGRAGAPLFLLTNHRRARPDSTPKMAYSYLP